MEIYKGDIIKVVLEDKRKEINCYIIYGLNIFSANYQEPKEFQGLENVPISEMIEQLIGRNHCYCLIGYPAIENWSNDEYRQRGTSVSINTLVEEGTELLQVPTSYYDGCFKKMDDYEYSTLFRIKDASILSKIVDNFILWDSVAFFASEKSDNTLKKLSSLLRNDNHIIDLSCDLIDYMIVSKGEGQYLEVYSQNNKAANIIKSSKYVESYIARTDWYVKNEERLFWDSEAELCLMLRD